MGQVAVVRHEKRVRGLFGRIVKWIFIIFNLLMLIWLVSYMADLGTLYNNAGSTAGQAGAAIGGTIGIGMLISLWAFGDIILGLFVLLTRGEKVIVEEAAPVASGSATIQTKQPDVADQLTRLEKLRARGALNQQEFDQLRGKLIGSI